MLKQKTIVLVKNDKGEVLEVLECKTLNYTEVEELKKQALENSAKYNALEKQKEKAKEQELADMKEEISILRKALANLIVENEVEKGSFDEDDEEEKDKIFGGLCL